MFDIIIIGAVLGATFIAMGALELVIPYGCFYECDTVGIIISNSKIVITFI